MKQVTYGFSALMAVALAAGAFMTAGAQGGAEKAVSVAATAPRSAPAGKPFILLVAITIHAPFHIQGNPTKEGYVPTVVKVTVPAGFKVGKITYPKAVEQKIAGETLPVYEKEITVRAEVTPLKAGKFKLPVTVRYQACNESACFPPTTATATASLTVAGKTVVSTR
jgi:DsbC/DsbD-like thiol-disulfide interchange protein